MRGSSTGALGRTYLHSAITEALWYAVAETERLFEAKLAHAVMLASLYGNPDAKLSEGNEQIHDMYLRALHAMPYIRVATQTTPGDADALVEEWRRLNERPADPAKPEDPEKEPDRVRR